MKKIRTLIMLVIVGLSFCANAQKIKFKEVKPLLKEAKYDEALPMLISFYKQNTDENGLWTNKAIMWEMDNMLEASSNIAFIYHNKAIKNQSIAFADSALIWYKVMIKDDHPSKSLVPEKIEKLKNLKETIIKNEKENKVKEEEKQKEILKTKERLDFANNLVYDAINDGYVEFEYNYYSLKIKNKPIADSLCIVVLNLLTSKDVKNISIDTSKTEYISNPSGLRSEYEKKYKHRDGRASNGIASVYNSSITSTVYPYSNIDLPVSDSSIINLRCIEILINYNIIMKDVLWKQEKNEWLIARDKEIDDIVSKSKNISKKIIYPNCPIIALKKYCQAVVDADLYYLKSNTSLVIKNNEKCEELYAVTQLKPNEMKLAKDTWNTEDYVKYRKFIQKYTLDRYQEWKVVYLTEKIAFVLLNKPKGSNGDSHVGIVLLENSVWKVGSLMGHYTYSDFKSILPKKSNLGEHYDKF